MKRKKRKLEKSLEERQYAEHRSIAQKICKLVQEVHKKYKYGNMDTYGWF